MRITVTINDKMYERMKEERFKTGLTYGEQIEEGLLLLYPQTLSNTGLITEVIIPELSYKSMMVLDSTFPIQIQILVANPNKNKKIVVYKPSTSIPHAKASLHIGIIEYIRQNTSPRPSFIIQEDIYYLLVHIQTILPRYKQYATAFEKSMERVRAAYTDTYTRNRLTPYEQDIYTAIENAISSEESDAIPSKERALIITEILRTYPKIRSLL